MYTHIKVGMRIRIRSNSGRLALNRTCNRYRVTVRVWLISAVRDWHVLCFGKHLSIDSSTYKMCWMNKEKVDARAKIRTTFLLFFPIRNERKKRCGSIVFALHLISLIHRFLFSYSRPPSARIFSAFYSSNDPWRKMKTKKPLTFGIGNFCDEKRIRFAVEKRSLIRWCLLFQPPIGYFGPACWTR